MVKKRKQTKFVLVFSIICFLILPLLGCQKEVPSQIDTQDSQEPDSRVECILDNISDNFRITLYSTRIITEDGNRNIIYAFLLENSSDKEYKNLSVSVILNSELDQYLAAGTMEFPIATIDLAPQNEALSEDDERSKGVDATLEQILNDDDFMNEAGLKYQDITELGKTFRIKLTWIGGEETLEVESNVIDES